MIRSKTCIIPSLDHLKACVADMIRDMPPPYRIVRQGVGVLTSAIAARVESKQVNGGGSAKERQPGHSAVTVGILLCPGLNGTELKHELS